jgi:hypothetical protein
VMLNTVGYDTWTVYQDNLVAVYGVWTHESGRYVLGASLFSKKEKKLWQTLLHIHISRVSVYIYGGPGLRQLVSG